MPVLKPVRKGFVIMTKKVDGGQFSHRSWMQANKSVSWGWDGMSARMDGDARAIVHLVPSPPPPPTLTHHYQTRWRGKTKRRGLDLERTMGSWTCPP